MNFDNEFDPYEALSTPLYQTATFKQVLVMAVCDQWESVKNDIYDKNMKLFYMLVLMFGW